MSWSLFSLNLALVDKFVYLPHSDRVFMEDLSLLICSFFSLLVLSRNFLTGACRSNLWATRGFSPLCWLFTWNLFGPFRGILKLERVVPIPGNSFIFYLVADCSWSLLWAGAFLEWTVSCPITTPIQSGSNNEVWCEQIPTPQMEWNISILAFGLGLLGKGCIGSNWIM